MIGSATDTSGADGLFLRLERGGAQREEIRPPTASKAVAPTVVSSTKSTTANPMSRTPATSSGRLPKPMNARISAIAPMIRYEVRALELEQQAEKPRVSRMNAMFGSDSRWRTTGTGSSSRSTSGASGDSTVTGALLTVDRPAHRPSADVIERHGDAVTSDRDRLDAATRPPCRRSIPPSPRCARGAPRSTDVGHRVVLDLLADRAGQSSPPSPTGEAAPCSSRGHVGEVRGERDEGPGAGSAPPLGVTQTTMGTGDSSSEQTMRWVASRLRPVR